MKRGRGSFGSGSGRKSGVSERVGCRRHQNHALLLMTSAPPEPQILALFPATTSRVAWFCTERTARARAGRHTQTDGQPIRPIDIQVYVEHVLINPDIYTTDLQVNIYVYEHILIHIYIFRRGCSARATVRERQDGVCT